MTSKNDDHYETTLKLAFDEREGIWKIGLHKATIAMEPVLAVIMVTAVGNFLLTNPITLSIIASFINQQEIRIRSVSWQFPESNYH
jgi:hypothetical protein